MQAATEGEGERLVYFAFDLLHLDGDDFRSRLACSRRNLGCRAGRPKRNTDSRRLLNLLEAEGRVMDRSSTLLDTSLPSQRPDHSAVPCICAYQSSRCDRCRGAPRRCRYGRYPSPEYRSRAAEPYKAPKVQYLVDSTRNRAAQ